MTIQFRIGMCSLLLLAGCVTEKPGGLPQFDENRTITLGAGQSVILARGQRAKTPSGTTVIQPGPGGNAVMINGQNNTVNAGAGVIVSVSANATGPADNIVIAQ